MRAHRRSLTIAGAFFVLAACTPTVAPPATETVPVVSPPAEVSPATTPITQPDLAESVDLCPRGMVWDPGLTYEADCFLVPVSFAPSTGGWRSRGVGAEWIEATWIDPETATPALHFVLLAYESATATDEVTEAILGVGGVHAASDVQPALLAGRTGVRVDVLTDPLPESDSSQGRRGGCSNSFDRAVDLSFSGPGYILMDRIGMSGGSVYGLGACFAFRVWVVEVDGHSLTLIVAAPRPDQLEAAASAVVSLFDTAVLGGT